MQSQMLTGTTRGADQQQQKSEREVAGSVAEIKNIYCTINTEGSVPGHVDNWRESAI